MAIASFSAIDKPSNRAVLRICNSHIVKGSFFLNLAEGKKAHPFSIMFDKKEVTKLRKELMPFRYICVGVMEPFFTNVFDPEHNYIEGLAVIDTHLWLVYEGEKWQRIENDHL